jgi:glycerol uptake facilitator-like aquaporin
MLTVLITMLGPVSGAHFNPAVTMVFWLRKDIPAAEALAYVAAQLVGAILGVMTAHLMFDLPVLQISAKARSGLSQAFSESVATFGLVATILLTLRARPQAVAVSVGLYITAAYWFTASTSFANPAVTAARALSDTFAGIRPADVAMFTAAQIVGALAGLVVTGAILAQHQRAAPADVSSPAE